MDLERVRHSAAHVMAAAVSRLFEDVKLDIGPATENGFYYDFDVGSDGFFWIFDQQCDNVAAYHSNECDVVYMNCSDYDPAGSYLLAVLAHELEHLIHYNHDVDEASWVDEGLAELAMWLYGNPDNISSFNTNPDRNLTSFTGAWADYIKTYLLSLYFYERYGGRPYRS